MIIDYDRSEAARSFDEAAKDLITRLGSRTLYEVRAGGDPALPAGLRRGATPASAPAAVADELPAGRFAEEVLRKKGTV
jgi:hypothetical protein